MVNTAVIYINWKDLTTDKCNIVDVSQSAQQVK